MFIKNVWKIELVSIKRPVIQIRKFDLFLKYEAFILKLFIKSEIIMSRKAITGAEGKINNPALNILISLVKIYWKFEIL